MTPQISLIVTCYNFEKYISEAVNSLLQLEGGYDYEIIIIDDGSRDQSDELIRKIKDDRIIYIRNENNIGAAACINEGFRIARGKYIARLDGDDVWEPDFLKITVPVLDQNPDVGLVYGDITTIDSDSKVGHQRFNVERGDLPVKGNEFLGILENYYVCAPTILARREAWELGLPWQERFRSGLGDWFISLCIAEKWNFYFIDYVLAKYRVHSTSMHHAYIKDKTGETNTEFILNYFKKSNGQLLTASQWKIIFSKHYLNLANSYFGAEMMADSRRCFNKAIMSDKSLLFNLTFIRLYLATIIGMNKYEKIKSLLK